MVDFTEDYISAKTEKIIKDTLNSAWKKTLRNF